MGKTPSPGKWIKSLLGKKSSKSSLDKGNDKLKSAKKEELVVKVKDTNNNVSNLQTNPTPVVVSSQEVATTQTVLIPDAVVPEKLPSGDIKVDEPNGNLESWNVTEELKLEEEDATKNLATVGAKIVIISNPSRRASTTMEKLKGLGFDPSFFTGAITSGELTHQSLQRRDDPWFAALGRRCIHITWKDRGAISLEGLDLNFSSGL